MVFERFSPAAQTVIVRAQDVARGDRSHEIGTDHLLLALTESPGTDASRALALLRVSEPEVRKRLERKGRTRRSPPPHIPLSPELKLVISAAVAWANDHGDLEISSEHLLRGLVYHPRSAGGRILTDLGVSLGSARSALAQVTEAAQPAEELPDAAQVATGTQAASRAGSAPRRQAAGAADSSIRSVIRVASPADQAWSLVSSPQVWALSPRGCIMFEVPGPDQLWLLAGELPGSRGLAPQCQVFEASTTPSRMELKLSARLRGPISFTFSVVPRRNGSADIIVTRAAIAVRGNSAAANVAAVRELDKWLRAIGNVLEGRSPRPTGEIPPRLFRAWTTERRIEQPVTKTAVVLIDAEPDAVWSVLQSAWQPTLEGWPPWICSGYVPGAPVGAIGEMRYGLYRRADGSPGSFVDVVIRYEDRHSTVMQDISPWSDRTSYRLTEAEGKSRLEITREWPAVALAARTEDYATKLLDSPGMLLDAYKTHIESTSRGTAERPEAP